MAPIPIPILIPIPSSLADAAAALSQLSSQLLKRSPTPTPTPTPTIPSLITRILTAKRDTTSIIPAGYGQLNSGPAPGTVVGIVLGSVGGFLLLLWLFYTCINFGAPGFGGGASSAYTESVVRERRKSHAGSRRSGRSVRERRASETIEIRTHAPPPRPPSPIRIVRDPSPARIIVEERREERRSRGDSDEVVVIEEHSPPRRKKSHREREERERESGFRTVDPMAYGGVVGGNNGGGRRGSRRG